MSKLRRHTKKNPCQICGNDWCGITSDGKFALCNRVADGAVKVTSTGSYVHVLIEDDPKKPRIVRPKVVSIEKPKVAKTSEEHLNDVYSAFLDRLTISYKHQADLLSRGLSLSFVLIQGYRSNPSPIFANRIAEKLSKTYSLENVPGFYFEKGSWKFQTYSGTAGIIVPIRNHKHQVIGLTVRADGNQKWSNGDPIPKYLIVSSANKPRGASSGTPHHFALLGKNFKKHTVTDVIVTEGALKANVCAEYSNIPVVGLISVTTFDDSFPLLLKEVFPKLQTVHIAFDMDAATNPAVKMHRDRLALTLAKIKLETSITLWNSGAKGLDEHLVSLNRQIAA